MFLMTGGARSVLDHVGFVEAVLFVTRFAFAIDRLGGGAVSKTLAQHCAEFSGRDVPIMTLGAIVSKVRMRAGNFSGVKKCFASAALKKQNRDQTTEERNQTDNQPCPAPRVEPAIITEVAFVALGDLLLRASGFRHRLNI